MAIVQIMVANPNAANTVVNTKTAIAGTVTQLGLDDTTTDAEQFLAAGCALVSVSALASLSARENSVFILYRDMHRP